MSDTIKKSLKVLGLSQSQQNDFQEIKSAFTEKMRAPFTYRNDRIKYNLAFEYLCNQLFQVQETQEEKSIIKAIHIGDIEFLKAKLTKKNQNYFSQYFSLKRSSDIINYRKKGTNYPLLYLAVRSGHYDVVKLILQSGCDLNFSKDRSTPMHCAAYYGHQHLIPLLFKYGIPTNIKNFADNIPQDEACKQSIVTLLKSARNDICYNLVQTLLDKKLAFATLNLTYEKKQKRQQQQNRTYDVQKVILKSYFGDYANYVDAFHGTNFDALASIAEHGLRAPGEKIDGKIIETVDGHIGQGVEVGGIKNWANAIFLSPSIFYSADPCYAKEILINGQAYCPVVQVKVKKGSFTQHSHTFLAYNLRNKQPDLLEFRVECKEKKDHIYRTPDYQDVKIVAILLIRQRFLAQNQDYKAVTNFILKSKEEETFMTKKIKY